MGKPQPEVRCLSGVDIRNLGVVIRADDLDAEQPFKLYAGDTVVAACLSPDVLGRWALDQGVQICRHSYDMVRHHASIHNPGR